MPTETLAEHNSSVNGQPGNLVDLIEAAVWARDGRRQGREIRFRCPVHAPDAHPSADYNPSARVWVCRVCHAGGGVQDLARRLGLVPDGSAVARFGAPATPESPAALAWRAVVRQARREQARLEPYLDGFRAADYVRAAHEAVRQAREVVARLGDTPRSWRLLARAARVETIAHTLEAGLDALSAEGRLT